MQPAQVTSLKHHLVPLVPLIYNLSEESGVNPEHRSKSKNIKKMIHHSECENIFMQHIFDKSLT